MAENLKTTKYRNGDFIGTTTPATLNITGDYKPEFQWAYAGNESNVTTYGRLYTCYAVTDIRDVCPAGWHIPTDGEWTTLTDFLGGENGAGGKLKETGTTHWSSPNTGATNETGFTALPNGIRSSDGTFYNIESSAIWWSSTEYSPEDAWYRLMVFNYADVYRYGIFKKTSLSVRCLRDN
jgi:uncharacterized protein (TIGR02145 family)